MTRQYYDDILLANVAEDYRAEMTKNLVGLQIFPLTKVTSPTGRIVRFSREDLLTVPDAQFDRAKGSAVEVSMRDAMQSYACEAYALKESVGNADIQITGGPYPRKAAEAVQRLTGKLLLGLEQRIATICTSLDATHSTTLSAETDATKENPETQWTNDNGDPIKVIEAELRKMPMRGNTMVLSRAVYDALRFHPRVVASLPSTGFQVVTPESLAVILQLERVLVGEGQIGKKSGKTTTISGIWGNSVVLAKTPRDGFIDDPCAGRTIALSYPAANDVSFVIRTWEAPELGVSGGRWYQVAHDIDECVVAPDLLRVIKNVL